MYMCNACSGLRIRKIKEPYEFWEISIPDEPRNSTPYNYESARVKPYN